MVSSRRLTGSAHSRELFFTSGADDGAVRSEIVASWRRSRLSGVAPDRYAVPFEPDRTNRTGRLARLAVPILSGFADHLTQTHTSLALTDEHGRIMWRWVSERYLRSQMDRLSVAAGFRFAEEHVGTNGIGVALELGRPVQVNASEHYCAALDVFCCTAAPVRDPITRRLLGAMNITCRARDASELLLPMIRQLARQVEARLTDEASPAERALLRSFVTERRHGKAPLVSMNEEVFISDRYAAELLAGLDQTVLWEQVRAGVSQPDAMQLITLPNGATLTARCRPVQEGDEGHGVLATIEPGERAHATRSPTPRRLPGLSGGSAAWQRTVAEVRAAAANRLPLLTVGESGVGKAALLSALADVCGVRTETYDAALEPVQGTAAWVAGVGEGLARHDGLIVLRHVAALSAQGVRALCPLLDAAVDRDGPRIAATCTTSDRSGAPVERGLLDRLQGVRIDVPPLRYRTEDIRYLVAGLARRHGPERPVEVLPDAMRALERYPWPGNVRQLDRVLRALRESRPRRRICAEDLPAELRSEGSRRLLSMVESAELDLIAATLERCGGNRALTARTLGMSRSTLYRRIRAYGLAR